VCCKPGQCGTKYEISETLNVKYISISIKYHELNIYEPQRISKLVYISKMFMHKSICISRFLHSSLLQAVMLEPMMTWIARTNTFQLCCMSLGLWENRRSPTTNTVGDWNNSWICRELNPLAVV